MKKFIIILLVLLLFITILPLHAQDRSVQSNSDYQVIPDEAIRLRILANSDDEDDQLLKKKIRDQVNKEITEWVTEIDQIEDARKLIEQRLPEIEQVVAKTLAENGNNQTYHVDYDQNVSFPAKVYDRYVYPAGEYEAILISLGEAKGANWWCVLFPPLCFLDFSAGTTVAEPSAEEEVDLETQEEDMKEEESVKVKFFFLEWFR